MSFRCVRGGASYECTALQAQQSNGSPNMDVMGKFVSVQVCVRDRQYWLHGPGEPRGDERGPTWNLPAQCAAAEFVSLPPSRCLADPRNGYFILCGNCQSETPYCALAQSSYRNA